MTYVLQDLPYAYDALEPYFDEKTMHLHHDRHHATYVKNLNAAIESNPDLASRPIEELLTDLSLIPENIRTAVRNNGGGHANHTFFWESLIPAKQSNLADLPIKSALSETFGSFDNFQQEFSQAVTGHFGSGWAWLVSDQGKLKITSTANQDSPLSIGEQPLLCLDLWEHAYYLKFYNSRPNYLADFWNIVNWDKVNARYLASK